MKVPIDPKIRVSVRTRHVYFYQKLDATKVLTEINFGFVPANGDFAFELAKEFH